MATASKTKIVVDSSVVVKWLLSKNEKYVENALVLLEQIRKGSVNCLAPELVKYEISNAVLNKKVSSDIAELALSTFYRIPIQYSLFFEELTKEAYKIAEANRITLYDSSFMALALREDAVLVTDNPKHQDKKISGLKVISLKDY